MKTWFVRQLNKLGYKDYNAYLSSPHWFEFTRQVKADLCFCCGSKFGLHVHHLTYDRLGQEKHDDVVTVCAKCHVRIHAMKNVKLSQRHLKVKELNNYHEKGSTS